MRCACIDIGSNTTRVLVADVEQGRLEEVLVEKAFTRLGRELRRTGALPPHAIRLAAEVVAAQRAAAERVGAQRLMVVATAAIRGAVNGRELCGAVFDRAGTAVRVLTGQEEAELAFSGAVRTFGRPLEGRVAVVDVGGGSCEIAVGTAGGGVDWVVSVGLGSGTLAEHCLGSDPPVEAELRQLSDLAAGAFAGLAVPSVDHAIAVGGSATSTARLVGPFIAGDRVASATALLCARPAAEVAREHDLDPERVRLLPAGLELLAAAAGVLDRPLEVGRGGLREGVCLELALS